jgi:hypothetical protein
MKITFSPRLYGLLGFLGFLGFLTDINSIYMFFAFFFFFVYTKPQKPGGTIFTDERWTKNLTKATSVAFFVFLIASMFNIAFLQSADIFLWVTYSIPIIALLCLVAAFVYYDLIGE